MEKRNKLSRKKVKEHKQQVAKQSQPSLLTFFSKPDEGSQSQLFTHLQPIKKKPGVNSESGKSKDQRNAPLKQGNGGKDQRNAPLKQGNGGKDQRNAPLRQENGGKDQRNAPLRQENGGNAVKQFDLTPKAVASSKSVNSDSEKHHHDQANSLLDKENDVKVVKPVSLPPKMTDVPFTIGIKAETGNLKENRSSCWNEEREEKVVNRLTSPPKATKEYFASDLCASPTFNTVKHKRHQKSPSVPGRSVENKKPKKSIRLSPELSILPSSNDYFNNLGTSTPVRQEEKINSPVRIEEEVKGGSEQPCLSPRTLTPTSPSAFPETPKNQKSQAEEDEAECESPTSIPDTPIANHTHKINLGRLVSTPIQSSKLSAKGSTSSDEKLSVKRTFSFSLPQVDNKNFDFSEAWDSIMNDFDEIDACSYDSSKENSHPSLNNAISSNGQSSKTNLKSKLKKKKVHGDEDYKLQKNFGVKKEKGGFVIKPAKVVLKGKPLCKKVKGQAGSGKRSPLRGNSPFAKRLQQSLPTNRESSLKVKKHLFDSDIDTNVKIKHEALSEMAIDVFSESSLKEECCGKQVCDGATSSALMADICHNSSSNKKSGHGAYRENKSFESVQDIDGAGHRVTDVHTGKKQSLDKKDAQTEGQDSHEAPTDDSCTRQDSMMVDSEDVLTAESDCTDSEHVKQNENEQIIGGKKENLDISAQWDDWNDSILANLDVDLLAAEGNLPKQKAEADALPEDLNRYLVKNVQFQNGRKELQVKSLANHTIRTCILEGVWAETDVRENNILAIHGQFDEQQICRISQEEGFIVCSPDLLLTGTAVSNTIRCMRRSVLSELFKGLDKGNKAMVLGTLLHEVFDKAIQRRAFDERKLRQFAEEHLKVPSFRNRMYAQGISNKELLKDSEEYYPVMKKWSEKYLHTIPKSSSSLEVKWPGNLVSEKCPVSLCKVADIEESVWSPRWGLKGKVDLSVNVKVNRTRPVLQRNSFTLPLELKSGRQTNSIEHRSQLVLYNLMMSDLDPKTPDFSWLLYLKTGAMISVTASHVDKRELIHLRNQLANHLSQKATKDLSTQIWEPPPLPEPIQDDFTCSRCSQLTACSILNRLYPSSVHLNDSMQTIMNTQIEHLNSVQLDYFSHWYLLCVLERSESKKRSGTYDIWNKQLERREKENGTLCGLKLSHCAKSAESEGFVLTFSKGERSPTKRGNALINCLVEGDWVVVSEEDSRRIARAIGTIVRVNEETLDITSESLLWPSRFSDVRFCVDKNESYDSLAASFVNLAKLMTLENKRLRELVVDLAEPNIKDAPQLLPPEAKAVLRELNSDQQKAVMHALTSQDYTLIVGMPGTGKTTTISTLVRILVMCGQSVLLTSYTHSAVDNILLKLIKCNINILRLGSSYRIHPDVQSFSEKTVFENLSCSQLGNKLNQMSVIATTCLGMKHDLLAHRHFDVCIIDEASQVSQPVCLGPLYKAKKFVLVGDHHQLPPLVQCRIAKTLGMDESLFKRLVEKHEKAVRYLHLQYRMHPEIMDISNQLVYNGALRCGDEKMVHRVLRLKNTLSEDAQISPWLQLAVKPQVVLHFFSTEKIAHVLDNQTQKVNKVEAECVKRVARLLVKHGCNMKDIGVISPYRLQCQQIESMLPCSVEVNTIDKYQGRDKAVIILSFAYHKGLQGGSILEDLRRLNVALTRAKQKLLMFGNAEMLRQFAPTARLIDILTSKGVVTVLEEGDAVISS